MEMNFESILLPGIEAKRPLVIAGPCSAESEEQVYFDITYAFVKYERKKK